MDSGLVEREVVSLWRDRNGGKFRTKGKRGLYGEFSGGMVTPTETLRELARQFNLDAVDLEIYPVDPSVASAIPAPVARRHHVVPIGRKFGSPIIAMANPSDMMAKDNLRACIGRDFIAVVALNEQVDALIERLYPPIGGRRSGKRRGHVSVGQGGALTRAEAAALAQAEAQSRNGTTYNGAPTNGSSVNGAPVNGIVSPPAPPPVNGAPINGAPVNGIVSPPAPPPVATQAFTKVEPELPEPTAAAPEPPVAMEASGATRQISITGFSDDADVDDYGANGQPVGLVSRGDVVAGLSPLVLEAEDPFLVTGPTEQASATYSFGHRVVDIAEEEDQSSPSLANGALADSEHAEGPAMESSDASQFEGTTAEEVQFAVPPNELAGQDESLHDIKSTYVEIGSEEGPSQEVQSQEVQVSFQQGSLDSEAEFSEVDQPTKVAEQSMDEVSEPGDVEFIDQNEPAEVERDDSEGGSSGLATTDMQPLTADVDQSQAPGVEIEEPEELYVALVPEAALSMGSEAPVSMELTKESDESTERGITDVIASDGLAFDALGSENATSGHVTNGHVMNGVFRKESTSSYQLDETHSSDAVSVPTRESSAAESSAQEPVTRESSAAESSAQEPIMQESSVEEDSLVGETFVESLPETESGTDEGRADLSELTADEGKAALSEPTADEVLTAALETVLANFSDEPSDEGESDQAAPLAVFAPPSPAAVSTTFVDLPPPPVPPKLDVPPPPGFEPPPSIPANSFALLANSAVRGATSNAGEVTVPVPPAPGQDPGAPTGPSFSPQSTPEEILGEAEPSSQAAECLMNDPLAEVSPEFLSQLPPLGRTLLKGGRVSVEDLERALATSIAEGVRLGDVLMRAGLIKESDLIWAMATELNLDFVDLDLYPVDYELASLLPESVARYNLGLPISVENGTLVVAVADPANVVAMENLKLAMGGKPFKPVVVVRRQLELFISQAYNRGREAAVAAESAAAQDEDESQENKVTDLQIVEDAPVIRYVNLIILQALNERASDIHIEPTPDKLRIRFRIDGVLHDMNAAPKNITSAVISRLKVLGGMDIAEHRIPQDGRSSIRLGERTIDLRLAAMPTVHGEKVVLRLLDKSQALLSLEELGFLPTMLERYVESYSKPYGTILVTGPTGSGKSTTLYATLNELNSANRNLITVEDPVEYQLPGISQVQVNVKSGLTFPVVLKSILRSDPDVILVGEIRDKETIVMVSEAALTGHLVLSTLHTNSAATTPMRLAEMGLEPYLITSAFNCVLTQRLARKLCVHCRRPVEVTEADLKAAGCTDEDIAFVGDEINVFQAVGCRACSNTGYRGRLALGEVMMMSEDVNRLVIDRATTEEIERVAIQEGLVPLRNDGLRKVLLGMTTFEEVLRVVA